MSSSDSNDDRAARIEKIIAEFINKDNADAAETLSENPDLMPELEQRLKYARMAKAAFVDAQEKTQLPRTLGSTKLDETFHSFPDWEKTGPATTRYDIQGEIARGGMGAILRVWDKSLNRFVAMKVILGDAAPQSSGATPPLDPRLVSRFSTEAQITGRLDHPGIVPVHELGTAPDGRAFFTMQIVKGQTLAEVFDLASRNADGWTKRRVLEVVVRVCETVAYAHDKGIIHRDLKPSNIMVGKFGEVYVMDWGLAKVLGESGIEAEANKNDLAEAEESTPLKHEPNLSRTLDGDVIGTPAYMAPEQARGSAIAVGSHADVYAIGAILYQFLAGHAPYLEPGKSTGPLEVVGQIIDGPPRAILEINDAVEPDLVKIVETAMARDPKSRYPDLLELANDLRSYLDRGVIGARKSIKESKLIRALILVLTIGLCFFGFSAIGVVWPDLTALSISLPIDLEQRIAIEESPAWIDGGLPRQREIPGVSLRNIRADFELTITSLPLLIAFLVGIVFCCGFIYLLRSILISAQDGRPFSQENVRRIKLLGCAFLAIVIYQLVLKPIVHYYILKNVVLSGGKIGILWIDPVEDILFSPWLVASAIIFMLAEVFRMGSELEKADSDQTANG